MKKVLTIAGSDCSGGAGIQADLKTMTAHKVYGMSVITALTAQNTTGVYGIFDASAEFIARQIDCVFTDIRPDAVKIGMVSSAEIIKVIAEKLREYKAENIVVDPVMVSTSGSRLLNEDAISALTGCLLPVADLITPNIPEAEVLCGFEIKDRTDMTRAALKITSVIKRAALIKGGHFEDCADDILCSASGDISWFKCDRVKNDNTHGTGCTLSSAIACQLALGNDMPESIRRAKEYVTGALAAGLDLGNGSGPLDHCYRL
ncbi:MAG: bifunctional hydroxymethylpyrimidine kinase/phosphomethylpyrimidine kinase [Synergistaceae bacterium]|nr:bifunctional hydroxymethylpyrimidine kinase/phosphomethylpyrimidine kinase [Synergistaceae bacterium]